MKIYSVYDSKANAYLQPFFSENAATARRAIGPVVHDENHLFHKYGEDYSLFEIGEFDENNGQITPQTLKSICNLWELRDENKQFTLEDAIKIVDEEEKKTA